MGTFNVARDCTEHELFGRIAGNAKVWLDGSALPDYRTATFQSWPVGLHVGSMSARLSDDRQK
jgi:hypothetical protein